jgi:Copper transport outer membrane protein, MctB
VIDFRYHLVSIVAVFLALAIGIVVGASAIKPGVLNVLDHASNSELHQIASQRTTIRNQQNQLGNSEAFAQSAAPVLLDGLLADQQVALITAPGADGPTISGITTALEQAGAKVTTQAQLQPAFFDTSAATQSSLEALAKQVAPLGLTLPTASPGTKSPTTGQLDAAQVLAAALVTKDGPDLPADETDPIISDFTRQGFLQLSPATGSAPAQATLAVVVIPASPPATDTDPANLALISVAEQLSLSSHGVVVAGSLNGSGPGSAIDELITGNTGAQLSSVNNADKEIGQIVVAQALSSLLAGHKPEAYGVGAAVPTPAPTPSPTSSGTSSASAATKHPSRA